MLRSLSHKCGKKAGLRSTTDILQKAQSPPGGETLLSGNLTSRPASRSPHALPGRRTSNPLDPYVSLLAEEQEPKPLAPASESSSSSSSSSEDRSPGSSAERPRESRHAGSDIVTTARAQGGDTQTPVPASRTAILPGRAT